MRPEFEAWHLARGAVLSGDGALSYGDPAGEYEALHARAGVWERGRWAVRRCTGADRVSFLHKYCTQEVRLDPGQGAYGCCLTSKGGLVGDVWLFLREDDVILITAPQAAEGLLKHLGRFALFDDIELAAPEEEQTLLSVWGPQAGQALEAALGSGPDLDVDLAHRTLTYQDQELFLARNDLCGLPGFDLLVPLEGARGLLEALAAAGAVPVGEEALTQVRVEAGVPLFGVDMTGDTIPVEAGLDARAISYDKGCYLGQEVMARIAHRGRVNRHLRGFRLPGDTPLGEPTALYRGEKRAGQVTSSVRSPRLGGALLGLGIVHRKYAEPGAELTLGGPEGPSVTVCALPL